MSIKKVRTIKDIRKEKTALKLEMKAIEMAMKSSVAGWTREASKSVAKAGLTILGVQTVSKMMIDEDVKEDNTGEEKPFYYPLMHMALDRVIEEIEDRI